MRRGLSKRLPLIIVCVSLLAGPAAAGEYVLGAEAMQRAFSGEGGMFALPQLRIYNSEGYLVGDAGAGYMPGHAVEMLEKATGSDVKPDRSRSLLDELADVRTAEGTVPPLPQCAELHVVKFWAEWCKPCHLLTDEIEAYMEQHPDLTIEIHNVEADPDNLATMPAPVDAGEPRKP